MMILKRLEIKAEANRGGSFVSERAMFEGRKQI